MTDVEDIVFAIPEQIRLVTLSTCAYDFENARFMVVGSLRELER